MGGIKVMKSFVCLAVSALAFAVASGPAYAQDPLLGRVYAFHSTAQSGCPALDWHLVTEGNGQLTGMISWNNMQDMARATGTYNLSDKTFQLTAKETSGQQRTATINGHIRADGWLIADITGPNVTCKEVTVPWYPAPGRVP